MLVIASAPAIGPTERLSDLSVRTGTPSTAGTTEPTAAEILPLPFGIALVQNTLTVLRYYPTLERMLDRRRVDVKV